MAQSGEHGPSRAPTSRSPIQAPHPKWGLRRCSPASTGTRWTTRDGSPSPRDSAPSWTRVSSSRPIHTRTGWDALADKGATLPITDEGARRFSRFIFAGAAETTLDGQGRVLIPGYLREMAGLAAEAVVVGARDHAEIWAPATWESYRRSLEDPTALAAAIGGLGI